jgi:spore coat assembly protein
MKQGDIVTRKSYGGDVLFKIHQISSQQAILRGVEYRLIADSPFSDLQVATNRVKAIEARSSFSQYVNTPYPIDHSYHPNLVPYCFELPGKVLHIDGDAFYLEKSMSMYRQWKVPARGFYIPEPQMMKAVVDLLPKIKPDIMVITGHDGLIKQATHLTYRSLSDYKNSIHFVQTVQIARQYERNRDTLTIIAGACQSHFEALIVSGANFASSPARILIHALDPSRVAIKMAYTSVKDTLSLYELSSLTVSGIAGVGGIETKGSYRLGTPVFASFS